MQVGSVPETIAVTDKDIPRPVQTGGFREARPRSETQSRSMPQLGGRRLRHGAIVAPL
jgi:hypothetical protein